MAADRSVDDVTSDLTSDSTRDVASGAGGAERPVRHILGLSGGKDSAALAVLLHKEVPQMEYFFCDTGEELQETYDYLDRLEARLGIQITRLHA